MATPTPEALAQRIAELRAMDLQFADAQPDDVVTTALQRPDVRLAEVITTVLTGYADRPALAQRATELVKDPAGGATRQRLLPRFDIITYGELGRRVDALLACLVTDLQIGLRPGDRVCLLGFTSVDYTIGDGAHRQVPYRDTRWRRVRIRRHSPCEAGSHRKVRWRARCPRPLVAVPLLGRSGTAISILQRLRLSATTTRSDSSVARPVQGAATRRSG